MLNIRRRIAEAVATAFNAQNPIGTPVLYIDDYGDQVWTTTRSEAWVVGGDDEATPVVKLQIGRGGYDLTRVIVHRGTQPATLPEIDHDEEGRIASCGQVFATIVRVVGDDQTWYGDFRAASWLPGISASQFQRIAQIAAEDRRADTAGKEGATDDTL